MRARRSSDSPTGTAPSLDGAPIPMVPSATSQRAEVSRPVAREKRPPPEPRRVARGVIIFDLDGTLLDDVGLVSHVAADVMHRAFGTPVEEARIHYLATTGLPFEAQLAQLYPEAPSELRDRTARTFHERKVREAYAHAGPFPEVPKLLKRLDRDGWTLVVSTGAETEMADLVLEREGLRYWFEDILGSAEGTKREHLAEYQRRYPGVPHFLIGDSRFDMEAAASVDGVVAMGRASTLHGWSLAPSDLERWGAAWADYSLTGLPEALARLEHTPAGRPPGRKPSARARAARPK